MKYPDGQEVGLGDVVDLGGEMIGTVVLVTRTGDHLPGFAPSDWTSLDGGMLMTSEQAGLVHYPAGLDRRLDLTRRSD